MTEIKFSGEISNIMESHEYPRQSYQRDYYTLLGWISTCDPDKDFTQGRKDVKIHFPVTRGNKVLECLIDDFMRTALHPIIVMFDLTDESGIISHVSGELSCASPEEKCRKYKFSFSPHYSRPGLVQKLNQDEYFVFYAESRYEIAYEGLN